MKVIIHPEGDTISVVVPARLDADIHDIAQQCVPEDVPYRIVNATDIPLDQTYREAWTADFSVVDGYGLGPQMWALKKQKEQS